MDVFELCSHLFDRPSSPAREEHLIMFLRAETIRWMRLSKNVAWEIGNNGLESDMLQHFSFLKIVRPTFILDRPKIELPVSLKSGIKLRRGFRHLCYVRNFPVANLGRVFVSDIFVRSFHISKGNI